MPVFPRSEARLAAAIVVAATAVAAGATAAPPSEGYALAKSVCISCHVIEAGQVERPILDPPAPSFADIASRPGTTAASLRKFVSTTHWDEKTVPISMPNPALMPGQVRAVVDYLMAQKTR